MIVGGAWRRLLVDAALHYDHPGIGRAAAEGDKMIGRGDNP